MKTTKEWFHIMYKKRRIRVRRILGAHDIVHDADGRVYTKRWKKDELLLITTPRKRSRHLFTEQEVGWICFHGGIADLERGMIAAIASGRQRVPQLESMSRRCKELGIKVQNLSEKSPQQRGAIKRSLARLNIALSRARSPELKEARDLAAVSLLMRDRRGRLNECVLYVRLSAIDRRVIERIENVYAWIPQISKRQAIAGTVHARAYLMARTVEQSAAQRLRNIVFKRTAWYQGQEKYLRHYIERDRALIQPWQMLRPYRAWALRQDADLALLADALAPHRVAEAVQLARRIHESAKLKLLQFEVFALLADLAVESDTSTSSYSYLEYQAELKRIGKAVRSINDSGWRNPVRDRVISHLTKAFRAFGSGDQVLAKEQLQEAAILM